MLWKCKSEFFVRENFCSGEILLKNLLLRRVGLHFIMLQPSWGRLAVIFLLFFFFVFFLPTMTVSPFNTWSSNRFKKRCEQLVFTPHRSWSRWKCRRHCKYSDYRLYILYILGHKWLKGWKKNHTSSRNISEFPLFYDFCLEPDWRLSDRVLLENKKKWGNFLVGVLALNQQQLNRNPTKTWKSTARYLIGPNKRPVNFSAKEVNCLMISKYLFTSSPFILAGKLYCL